MIEFLQVAEGEDGECMELPTEEDGTLLLSTVVAQFPGALGLRYKATPESTAYRGVRLAEGVLHPPPDGGWQGKMFICSFPKENKRKVDDESEEESGSKSKMKRMQTKIRCTDLIVLGLPYKTTEKDLQEYFEKFGELLVVQVKSNKDGSSRGYGFIRYAQYDSQMRALAQKHMIDGRWCEVKIPSSKEGVAQQLPRRVFVGRCTEDITVEDLKTYFTEFGEVTDVFVPKPFRAFCFVTFSDPEVAQALCGEDHIIKGVSVHVSSASPKTDKKREKDQSGGHGSAWDDDRYNNSGPKGSNNFGGSRGGNNMDMNLGPLMNPAFVAAALKQAGWGFMGNMGGNQDNYNGPSGGNGPNYRNSGSHGYDNDGWGPRSEPPLNRYRRN